MNTDFSWWMPGMFFMPVFMIFFLVVLVAAVALVLKWIFNIGPSSAPPHRPERTVQSALEVLKIRYAKGEIDKQEFEEKKKDLSE